MCMLNRTKGIPSLEDGRLLEIVDFRLFIPEIPTDLPCFYSVTAISLTARAAAPRESSSNWLSAYK